MRSSGILLHITSLPETPFVGDMGPVAYRFVDFLKASGQKVWQILPLNPTHSAYGNSPYTSFSLFAGNPILISLEKLAEYGLLRREELPEERGKGKAEYDKAYEVKEKLLRAAFERFRGGEDFERFCEENAFWLEDYALFEALRRKLGHRWEEWGDDIKRRRDLEGLRRRMGEELEFFRFVQFIFYRQWHELKSYANSKGIKVMGDLPIYPAYHSADVWSNPHLFKLDTQLRPTHVAGVPPDYFSETGQLWGNPVYNWKTHEEEGFRWWVYRFAHAMKLFDILRIDHFRGYVAYWEVPYGEETAVKGRWVEVPYRELFRKVFDVAEPCRLVAEDLGYITPDVELFRRELGIPGMRVLQFGFLEEDSPHLPHNCTEEVYLFTGTHDNPPLRGWFRKLPSAERENLRRYLGFIPSEEEVCEKLIRLSYLSRAKVVILPMQDVLCLGEEARMNTPAKAEGNWLWRLEEIPGEEVSLHLKDLTKIYGR